MEPFHQIVPDAHDPVTTLVLDRKTGRIPKGSYGFVEYYCCDPDCDCRRVLLLVFNEKKKQKAAISFGFDQQGPMAGPYLDGSGRQAPYACELLEFFVHSLNSGTAWLDRLYRQYRQVREKVAGRRYRGKAFPKPGELNYRTMPPPDLEAEIEQSLRQLRPPSPGGIPVPRSRKCCHFAPPGLAGGLVPDRRISPRAPEKSMAYFIERYAMVGGSGLVAEPMVLRDELQQYLFRNLDAGDELAALLPVICRKSPEDDEKIEAALRLLRDTLEFFRVELEDREPGALRQMARLQEALARRIYLENEDLDLRAAVSNTLLRSGVEILPVLREAHGRMLAEGAARLDLQDLPGEEVLAGITRSIETMGLASPFEGVQALQELFALNEPQLQTALIAELLEAENPLLRDMSALMLFSPEPAVRLGVSQLLAAADGRHTTPENLRRLIVSRNWFAEPIRKNIDQAITNARRARVGCAPLAKAPAMTVHASPIDGSGAQSFQVVVRDGKGYYSCSILLKQGVGVADAFVIPLKGRRYYDEFLALLNGKAFIASTQDHLDQRVCQALADGVRRGVTPNHWLVRIAELLGRDRWNAAPFDLAGAFDQLRKKLGSRHRMLSGEVEYRAALEESGQWHQIRPLFSSWFEADDLVLREMEASRGNRKGIAAAAAADRILSVVVEMRRELWLERLVLEALWLASSKQAPLAWRRVYHVAMAVADRSIPLGEIPLMRNIARLSCQVCRERQKAGGNTFGAGR